MNVKELRLMSEKERTLWFASAKSNDLVQVLKNYGIKGISKINKSEKLSMVASLVIEDEVKDEDIKKIMEDTKKLNEEINIRRSCGESIEQTLYARYKNKEIKFNELRKVCDAYNVDIPLSFDEKSSISLIDGSDEFSRKLHSEYEHYDYDYDRTYYSVLSKDFKWDKVFRNNGKYIFDTWLQKQISERNTVDRNGFQLAFDFDENDDVILLIYKNYELLGAYKDGDIDDIKTLIVCDDKFVRKDFYAYENLLELLIKQYEECYEIVEEYLENCKIIRNKFSKETDKNVYKRFYRIASSKINQDISNYNIREMDILNDLKENWGI